MKKAIFLMTPTALVHLKKAVRDTKIRWGIGQAEIYKNKLIAGFGYIAENHKKLNSLHRKNMVKGTEFSVHLIEHHYIVFQEYDKNTIIIAGIFHEAMDIPAQLQELNKFSEREIEKIKKSFKRKT